MQPQRCAHGAPANGRAGYVRIDTVHQGDLDGIKGVYHITCVDAVSQWQVQVCVQGISEAYLLPVLLLITQFPFEIEGFHSDNGSEYINGRVAAMLEKVRIEQTKSRSRHSNKNWGQIEISTIQKSDLNWEAPLTDSDVKKPGLPDKIILQTNRYSGKQLLNT